MVIASNTSKDFDGPNYWPYRTESSHYFGHSGTGFSEKGMRETIERLKPLLPRNLQSKTRPRFPRKSSGVAPQLVCEVAFAEWTEEEQLRQTTFLGWRDDKSAREVVL
jgi:bifunctional non-homologous end joining protein LigD